MAAFTPERAPELTAIFHEFGWLMFITPLSLFPMQLLGIIYLCFTKDEPDNVSAFPRWLGYLTAWQLVQSFGGPMAVLFKTGIFSWNGLLPFWLPFGLFSVWYAAICWTLLRALRCQKGTAQAAFRSANSLADERTGHIPGEAGVWLLIFGEMSFFTALFASFLHARNGDVAGFMAGQAELSLAIGVVNTLLLLTSSLFVARAVAAVKRGDTIRHRACSRRVLAAVWASSRSRRLNMPNSSRAASPSTATPSSPIISA